MNRNTRKCLILMMIVCLCLGLTGCEDRRIKTYQRYVESLIAINYLGETKSYMEASGATQEEADTLYQGNVEFLTDNILTYYGVNITDAPEMRDEYIELSKHIYSKVNYDVSAAYPDGSVYLLDVTIYPIDLFAQTSDEVVAYVDAFNEGVKNGDYNDYTLTEYETEFSKGLLNILNEGCINMTYCEPVTITVEIVEEGDTYYLKERDFLRIDAAMISASIPEPLTTEEDSDNSSGEN